MKGRVQVLLAFLIGASLRAFPELSVGYPIGSDTPVYMSLMASRSSGMLEFPISEILGYYGGKVQLGAVQSAPNVFYAMLGALGRLGVDPSAFFKLYPPIAYGLLAALSAMLLVRCLRLDFKWIPVASALVALNPSALRIGWDLHRQMFGLLLALAALVLIIDSTGDRRGYRIAASLSLGALVGFTHELALLALLASLIALSIARRSFLYVLPAILGVFGFIYSYAPIVPLLPKLILFTRYSPAGITFRSFWERASWWVELLMIAGGYLLFSLISSRPRSPVLLGWLVISIVPYASFLGGPTISVALPERFLFLWFLPLSGFLLASLSRGGRYSKVGLVISSVMVFQAVSMLGFYGGPLPPFKGSTLNVFVDHMTTSLPVRDIDALQHFSKELDGHDVVLVDHALTSWSIYELRGHLVLDRGMNGWWKIAHRAAMNGSLALVWYKGSSPPSWLCRLVPEDHYGRLVIYSCVRRGS